ncbi:MAG: methionyl-tRNA formyltransferase, partial [Acidimicrobiia bacterium]|nr:methionyl-tRNA formyltransferase [Acidimicrobiia bacterium]
PPVKMTAQNLGIEVAQPAKSSEIAKSISDNGDFDLGVVVAYGRILRPDVLALPRMGLLNLHFSLLPRWRGAAPVARALLAGDQMTGVTIIKIDEGLDTGPVLTAQAVDIGPSENAGELTDRLANLGARLIADVIPRYVSGDMVPVEQSDDGLEYADKVTPEDRPLDVEDSPDAFVNRVRALAPNPGATLEIDEERFKILGARVIGHDVPIGEWHEVDGQPVVGVEGGSVALLQVQPPGKRAMTGEEWLRGSRKARGVAR